MHEDRHRAGSFGEDAEQYDRARPSYQAELVDDLFAPGIHRVIDRFGGRITVEHSTRLITARGRISEERKVILRPTKRA